MGWSQDDLDRIEKQIAAGEKRVEDDSGSVTYRDLDDLYRIREKIRAELGQDDTDSRVVIAQYDKGL